MDSGTRSGPQRRALIVRLLETRNDHLPEALDRETLASRNIGSRSSHTSGFVHGSVPLTCPDCLANGKDRMPGCETCGGSGHVMSKDRRDPMADAKTMPYGLDGSHHDRRVAIERAISVARYEIQRFPGFRPRSSADELAEANRRPHHWEAERRRMYEEFDYAALEVALEQLHSAHPGVSPLGDLGLAFIDERMPDPIRAPGPAEPVRVVAKVHRSAGPRARFTRDVEIRARAEEGAAVDELMREFGLGKSSVYAIVNGYTSDAAA